ncbi:MAG: class I SAM-dependent methyltransferase [Alphaproteobacteria bacterium]|nr:class I SAM-dependent methyltransferase [Alphaproteobacteria bacterium]
MFFPPNLAPEFMKLIKPFWESEHPDHIKLQVIWGMLNGCQGAVISQLLASRIGDKVFAGPFRGMQLIKEVLKWHFSPTLLGTYEWEIHDAIESVIASKVTKIINVGCAYGYYSIGLALRMPQATVYAYDIDPQMREQCRKMAELNGVADRMIIGERFNGEDYERFANDDSFILMDIEGGEMELLDPQKFPALKKLNVIVELHDYILENASDIISLRFAETHNIKIVPNAPFSFPLEKILGPDYTPDHFDNLIATWESRGGPTPFGIFTKK